MSCVEIMITKIMRGEKKRHARTHSYTRTHARAQTCTYKETYNRYIYIYIIHTYMWSCDSVYVYCAIIPIENIVAVATKLSSWFLDKNHLSCYRVKLPLFKFTAFAGWHCN